MDRLRDPSCPNLDSRQLLALRVKWGIDLGFTFVWQDRFGPYGALMIRPVNIEILEDSSFDYWEHVWDYDSKGDIVAVDFAYGAGLYPDFIERCRSTNRPWIAWRHRDRTHLVPIAKMPAKNCLHSLGV
jgi:hypothetical protein